MDVKRSKVLVKSNVGALPRNEGVEKLPGVSGSVVKDRCDEVE